MSRINFVKADPLMNVANVLKDADMTLKKASTKYNAIVALQDARIEEIHKKQDAYVAGRLEKNADLDPVKVKEDAMRKYSTLDAELEKGKAKQVYNMHKSAVKEDKAYVRDVVVSIELYDAYKKGVESGNFNTKGSFGMSFNEAIVETCFDLGIMGAHHKKCANALCAWIGASINKTKCIVKAKSPMAFASDFIYAVASYAIVIGDWSIDENTGLFKKNI